MVAAEAAAKAAAAKAAAAAAIEAAAPATSHKSLLSQMHPSLLKPQLRKLWAVVASTQVPASGRSVLVVPTGPWWANKRGLLGHLGDHVFPLSLVTQPRNPPATSAWVFPFGSREGWFSCSQNLLPA